MSKEEEEIKPFCYDDLDPEKRAFVLQKTNETHGLLKHRLARLRTRTACGATWDQACTHTRMGARPQCGVTVLWHLESHLKK